MIYHQIRLTDFDEVPLKYDNTLLLIVFWVYKVTWWRGLKGFELYILVFGIMEFSEQDHNKKYFDVLQENRKRTFEDDLCLEGLLHFIAQWNSVLTEII